MPTAWYEHKPVLVSRMLLSEGPFFYELFPTPPIKGRGGVCNMKLTYFWVYQTRHLITGIIMFSVRYTEYRQQKTTKR